MVGMPSTEVYGRQLAHRFMPGAVACGFSAATFEVCKKGINNSASNLLGAYCARLYEGKAVLLSMIALVTASSASALAMSASIKAHRLEALLKDIKVNVLENQNRSAPSRSE